MQCHGCYSTHQVRSCCSAAVLQCCSAAEIADWAVCRIRTLVLAAWFTCRSSTGSRRETLTSSQPNLRCPRNGKWTNLLDSASITATERSGQTLGKAMEVASTSPDTGQQGGCTPACGRTAHALSGTTVRAFAGSLSHEKSQFSCTPVGFAVCLGASPVSPFQTQRVTTPLAQAAGTASLGALHPGVAAVYGQAITQAQPGAPGRLAGTGAPAVHPGRRAATPARLPLPSILRSLAARGTTRFINTSVSTPWLCRGDYAAHPQGGGHLLTTP